MDHTLAGCLSHKLLSHVWFYVYLWIKHEGFHVLLDKSDDKKEGRDWNCGDLLYLRRHIMLSGIAFIHPYRPVLYKYWNRVKGTHASAV